MTSLPYPAPPLQAPEDDGLAGRLRGLSQQQLLEAMQFLAWWSPGVFTAVVDCCEAGNWGADDFDPDLGDSDRGRAEPAPLCAQCGGDLGIFLRFGLDWRHYKGVGLDNIELYDPGHLAEVTWRTPALAAARMAA